MKEANEELEKNRIQGAKEKEDKDKNYKTSRFLHSRAESHCRIRQKSNGVGLRKREKNLKAKQGEKKIKGRMSEAMKRQT